MPLIKLDNSITDISGQIGGVYFSRDKSGLHARKMPRNWRKLSYTEPMIWKNSPKGSRGAYIKSWTNVARFYRDYFVGLTLFSWFAGFGPKLFPKGKAKGRTVPVYQWFMYFNIPRAVQQKHIYTYPPRAHDDLPSYVLTGEILEPGAQNLYKAPGQYYGHDYYVREGTGENIGLGYLWYKEGIWYITTLLGDPLPAHYWYLDSDDPTGQYTEVGGAFGTLKVEF